MKHIFFFLALSLPQFLLAQTVELTSFRFKGLSFHSSKEKIIERLGEADSIYDPHYECGFLSSEEQGIEFSCLDYGGIKFTGNAKDLYLIEEINFKKDPSLVIEYASFKLSANTSLDKLAEIFGAEIRERLEKGEKKGFVLNQKGADDGIYFELVKGKLALLSYWSPC